IWVPLVFWLYVFRNDSSEWTSSLILAVAMVSAMALTDILKAAFNLPRPSQVPSLGITPRGEIPTNPGFPSGHTTNAFTVATVIWSRYPVWRIPFGLRVCEEPNPSTALTEERVQVEDIFSELRPVSQEDVSSSACSSGSEWNVAHVNHSRVAALTLHGKASLRSGFRQYSSIGSLGLLSIKLSSRSVSLIRTLRQHTQRRATTFGFAYLFLR